MLAVLIPILWKTLPCEKWVQEACTEAKFTLREAIAFLTDRKMGALLVFFIIPCALINVCLFQFFIPISLSQSGTSPADIGRVFLVYCLIIMFGGPYLAKHLDASKKMYYPLTIALVFALLSILPLVVFDGLTAATICVCLLGICIAITANGQGPYALSLPASQRMGRARTMGAYNVSMRIGQILGPIVLSLLMTFWSEQTSLLIVAAFALICITAFFVLSRSASPKENGKM